MANSLLIVTPLYRKDHTTYPAGGGKCHKPAFFRPGVTSPADWTLENPPPLCSCTAPLGWKAIIVLSSSGLGWGWGVTSRADRAPKNPSTLPSCLASFSPHYTRCLHPDHTVQKPQSQLWKHHEPGFPISSSCTLSAYSTTAPVRWLGAGRNRTGITVSSGI